MSPLALLWLLACGPAPQQEASDTAHDTAHDTADTGDSAPRVEDGDRDGYGTDVDCDDDNAHVHPGAPELCNDLDDDCDEAVDADDPDLADGYTGYLDEDADGFGGPTVGRSCTSGAGLLATADDCNDADPAVNPDAAEACNGHDDDCDTLVDEADPDLEAIPVWHGDTDADGYGGRFTIASGCQPPSGYVANQDDCDDTDASVNPDADEVCDGADNDCDDLVDDADADLVGETLYQDLDGDGHGTAGATALGCDAGGGWAWTDDDCDDTDAATYPYATEFCNGVDDDCDGTVDEATATDAHTWYGDTDGDTYGDAATATRACAAPAGMVSDARDCDDRDATVYPAAPETLGDGVDSNCDGASDDDGDGDGWVLDDWAAVAGLPGGDCDDADATVHPEADEHCDDRDEDCDGEVDEGEPVDAATWYTDADADGYGDPATAQIACEAPAGASADGTDCDDTDAAIYGSVCTLITESTTLRIYYRWGSGAYSHGTFQLETDGTWTTGTLPGFWTWDASTGRIVLEFDLGDTPETTYTGTTTDFVNFTGTSTSYAGDLGDWYGWLE